MTTYYDSKLISISPDRVEAFKQRNPHIKSIDATLGVREEDLDPEQIAAAGIATREIIEAIKNEPKGNIGNAHSMFHIFNKCIAEGRHTLVMEDDATLHAETDRYLTENWQDVKELDFLALGANTDAVICFEPTRGMKLSGVFLNEEDKHPGYDRIRKILDSFPARKAGLYKLHNMFGTCAFLVSPNGAGKLLQKAFPLDSTPIDIPLLPHRLLGVSFDRRMNAFLGEIDARICMPFLAMTPNDSKSER